MPNFAYRALSPRGRADVGLVEAADSSDALRMLGTRGLTVTSLEVRHKQERHRAGPKRKLRPDDIVALLREWAILLAAGLTVDEALAICSADGKSSRVIAAIKELRRAIRDGKTLNAALRETRLLPREAIVLIEAGESAGAMPKVLERLADDFAQKRATQDGLVTALLYPAVLLVTTFAAVCMIVLIVAPNLAELFENSSAAPPARITALLGFAAFVRLASPIGGSLVLGAAAFLFALSRYDGWRLRFDAFFLHLPFFGELLRSRDSARFAGAAALMIHCGVVPTKALPLAASAMANAYLRAVVSRALESAAQGVALHEALLKARALPSDLLALIDAGVRTGRLGEVLHHGGALHAARASSKIHKFCALLTPAITVFAGVVVGTLAYLVLSAVVSLNEIAFQ